MELPEGTSFSGNFEFTCFYIPDNAAITADGPLTIKASTEMAVFGTVRLSNGGDFSTTGKIDLRTSAWLSEDHSAIRFATTLEGEITETSVSEEIYSEDVPVPDIEYESLCLTSADKGDDSGSSGGGCFIDTAQHARRAKIPEPKFIDRVFSKHMHMLESGEWYIWDPLAAVIAIDPGLCEQF